MSFLEPEFMQRALIAGALIGLAAPSIGVFIVQRRLALMGDGIGHVAFTGVAAGLVMDVAPVLTAIVFAVLGAIALELLREKDHTSGDMALALIFYGGIAGGLLLLGLADVSTLNLHSYLFGSVLTVNEADLILLASVSGVVIAVTAWLRRYLFVVAYDEEVARASGLPVRILNIATAVIAALTIAIASKVVGILLVSSMLVLPVATVQQLTRSFRTTVIFSLLVGVAVTEAGLIATYYVDAVPAATIVLTGIGLFMAASAVRALRAR